MRRATGYGEGVYHAFGQFPRLDTCAGLGAVVCRVFEQVQDPSQDPVCTRPDKTLDKLGASTLVQSVPIIREAYDMRRLVQLLVEAGAALVDGLQLRAGCRRKGWLHTF